MDDQHNKTKVTYKECYYMIYKHNAQQLMYLNSMKLDFKAKALTFKESTRSSFSSFDLLGIKILYISIMLTISFNFIM